MGYQALAGQLLAAGTAYLTHQEGRTITWNGNKYAAQIEKPDVRAMEFLAVALPSFNAANKDIRFVYLAPADFTNGFPQEGETLTLVENGNTRIFEIAAAPDEVVSDIPNTTVLIVFRQPPTTSAQTTERTNEPNPGQSINVDWFPTGT